MAQDFSGVIGCSSWFYFDGCACGDETFLFFSSCQKGCDFDFHSENHISLHIAIYSVVSPSICSFTQEQLAVPDFSQESRL